jgi:hypothetical protein
VCTRRGGGGGRGERDRLHGMSLRGCRPTRCYRLPPYAQQHVWVYDTVLFARCKQTMKLLLNQRGWERA